MSFENLLLEPKHLFCSTIEPQKWNVPLLFDNWKLNTFGTQSIIVWQFSRKPNCIKLRIRICVWSWSSCNLYITLRCTRITSWEQAMLGHIGSLEIKLPKTFPELSQIFHPPTDQLDPGLLQLNPDLLSGPHGWGLQRLHLTGTGSQEGAASASARSQPVGPVGPVGPLGWDLRSPALQLGHGHVHQSTRILSLAPYRSYMILHDLTVKTQDRQLDMNLIQFAVWSLHIQELSV